MAIEIEKKFRLTPEQYKKILAGLEKTGAIFLREDFEVNELYGGGILRLKNAVLRIRKIQGVTILTYKERIKNDSEIKHQIEYETEVSNEEAIEKIIESLGFKKVAVYEKRRQTWELNGVEILLDELPFGLFMEIEGSIENIAQTEMLLEATDFETEHQTYPRLTEKFGRQNGEVFEARFTEIS
jgi:adenylate cyclase, class 2